VYFDRADVSGINVDAAAIRARECGVLVDPACDLTSKQQRHARTCQHFLYFQYNIRVQGTRHRLMFLIARMLVVLQEAKCQEAIKAEAAEKAAAADSQPTCDLCIVCLTPQVFGLTCVLLVILMPLCSLVLVVDMIISAKSNPVTEILFCASLLCLTSSSCSSVVCCVY
jgi:hypothetical protein